MENRSVERSLHDMSNQIVSEFLHSCVNAMCGKCSKHSYDNFKSCTNWTKDEFDFLSSELENLFWNILELAEPDRKIMDTYPSLTSSHVKCIVDCLTVRKVDIQNVLICKSYAISGSMVHDFDWKLKWVMGSSSLSSLREPLLLLDFNMYGNEDGTGNSSVNLELNSDELKMLITALEKAELSVKSS